MLEPKTSSAANAVALAHRRQHLERRLAGARQVLFSNAPHRRDVAPSLGIVDSAVSGQLIGFLPVLAAPLAVALPGHATVAAGWPPDLSERQREVDVGERVVHALRLLLRSRGR